MGSRVTLETSWPPTMAELDQERLVAIIRRHGADRVVFGSDWPMADPAAEIAAIRALALTPRRWTGSSATTWPGCSGSIRMSDKVVRLGAGHGVLGRPRAVPPPTWSSAATSTTCAATTSPS